MSLSVLVTAVLLGQSAFALDVDKTAPDVTDVAYHELAAGQSQAAVQKLEAGGAAQSNDPAALINLGSAYARAGMADKALAAYRAAVASPDRYDLELADGSWVDSRVAARMALRGLMASRSVAAR
jgi:cytochrome c-type biogenesis protein CcmH/NrfG